MGESPNSITYLLKYQDQLRLWSGHSLKGFAESSEWYLCRYLFSDTLPRGSEPQSWMSPRTKKAWHLGTLLCFELFGVETPKSAGQNFNSIIRLPNSAGLTTDHFQHRCWNSPTNFLPDEKYLCIWRRNTVPTYCFVCSYPDCDGYAASPSVGTALPIALYSSLM